MVDGQAVSIIDDNYYVITLLITIVIQLSCFAIAYKYQIDKITDFAGSTNFIILAVITLVFGGFYTTRGILCTAFLALCRLELAVFLLARVLQRGHDARFDEMRSVFKRFLGFWIFQIFWVYLVSLPVVYVNSEDVDPEFGEGADVAGVVLFVVGFLLQTAADFTKKKFRDDPANKHTFCDKGVWAWSRHPNYAGEIMLWLGIWLITLPVIRDSDSTTGYVGLISPIFTTLLLLFLSGIPTSEGKNQARWYKNDVVRERYIAYRAQTSPVWPLPPALYKSLPMWLKRTVLCEFKRYEYNEVEESLMEGATNPTGGEGSDKKKEE